MEVSAEAKRIMVVALGKLYSSRTQRGGLRLHRSLLLTLVMKSARDIYHAAQTTVESVSAAGEQQQYAAEMSTEPRGAQGLQTPASLPPEQPHTSPHLPDGADTRCSAEDKENMCPSVPTQHTRKRRGKAAAEPDFLPCKKAKLEHGNSPQQLLVNSVLVDFVTCSSKLGPPPTPIPLQTAIAAC
ncbi:immediate early response gene 2 protein [Odontesthes bonariensis]|uniref:immediate early response gene 2 protein n=1 Tax=Odontesthes bonariensis TaxID=219752 RepID=UPI003F5893CC